MDGLGLTNVYQTEGGESRSKEHVAPVDAREVGHQLVVRHLMIVLVHIPQFHHTVAGLGDARLDGHHGLHLLLGRCRVVAHEHEEVLQIGLVGLSHACRLRIVVQIVVAQPQSESALTDAHDVHLRIAHVGTHADAVHHRLLTHTVDLSRHQLVLLAVLDGGDAVECRLQRCPALTVQAHAVHHQVVERAYLLSQRALLLRRVGKLQDQVLDTLLVLVIQIGEGTVVGMLVVQRMRAHPSACGILVEVVTRSYRGVKIGGVDTRRQRLCASRSGQHQTEC